MTLRISKWLLIGVAALLLLGGGLGVGLAVSGASDKSDETTTAATADDETTAETTTEAVTDETTEVDVNETLIEEFAQTNGGKNLAGICRGVDVLGPGFAEKEGKKQLGSLIIARGGDVSEVIDGLLDRC